MQIEKPLAILFIVLLSILFLVANHAEACDACSSSQVSFTPEFANYQKKHSLSFVSQVLLYRMNMKEEVHLHGGKNGYPQMEHLHQNIKYEERHFSYELRGVYCPHKRVALTGILPFIQRKLLKEGETLENQFGLGDAIIIGQYHIINRLDSDTVKTKHRLSIGGGIKLPTGKYNMVGYDGLVEPKRQSGTGSADFLFNLQYLLVVKNFGVNTSASYKVNTQNKNYFKFANSFNGSFRLFYDWKIKSFGLIPNTGINFDQMTKDRQSGKDYYKDSGGMSIYNSYGLDIYFKNFGMSFNYNLPVYEKLDGMQFESTHQFMTSVRYVFKDKYGKNKKIFTAQ